MPTYTRQGLANEIEHESRLEDWRIKVPKGGNIVKKGTAQRKGVAKGLRQ